MSFLMPKPKTPTPAPMPSAPAVEDTALAASQYESLLRKRRGRAASVLSSRGDQPQTASATLLGG
jgi:hypothetical protein